MLEGDLDRQNAWALTAAILRARESDGDQVVLDLHAVQFIDAGGLRALADAGRQARRQGRRFALACPSQDVVRLLKLTGLDRTLLIVPRRPHMLH